MFFGIVLLCLAGLTWIVFGVAMGRASVEKIPVGPLLFLTFALAFTVGMVLGFFQGQLPASPAHFAALAVLMAGGVVNSLQLVFMARAMERGPNGVVWSITQSGFIIPFLFGTFFYHSRGSIACWGGFAAVLAGLFILGCTKGRETREQYSHWRLPAFLAFAATGISQTLSNIPSYYPEVNELSSTWKTAALALGMALGPVLFSPWDGGIKRWFCELKKALAGKRIWIWSLVMEFFNVLNSCVLLFPGMDALARHGVGAIAYPLMVCSCIIGFEVYSVLLLKERRTVLQCLALLLCLTGAVALAF